MYAIVSRSGAVLVLWAAVGTSAGADQLEVEIRNARPGREVEVSVRSSEANGAARGTVDAAGTLRSLLAVANLGKAQPAQVRIDECSGKPDRLTVVGTGAEPAVACEGGRTRDGCTCHELGAYTLAPGVKLGVDWGARTLAAESVTENPPPAFSGPDPFDPGPDPFALALLLGVGAELSYFPNPECAPIDGFRATCDLDKAGLAPVFLAEFGVRRWLRAGAAYEPIEGVHLERELESSDTPGLEGSLKNGRFNPAMWKIYVEPTFGLTDNVSVHGQLGVGRWSAMSGNRSILRFNGETVLDEVSSQEDSGYSAVFGAGLDYWPTRRFGLRLGWEYAKLSKEEAGIDEAIHNLRAIILLNVFRR